MTGAPSCGDVMRLQLKLNGDTIEDVKFKTYGCGSAIASSTMFVEMLRQSKKLNKLRQRHCKSFRPPLSNYIGVLAEKVLLKQRLGNKGCS